MIYFKALKEYTNGRACIEIKQGELLTTIEHDELIDCIMEYMLLDNKSDKEMDETEQALHAMFKEVNFNPHHTYKDEHYHRFKKANEDIGHKIEWTDEMNNFVRNSYPKCWIDEQREKGLIPNDIRGWGNVMAYIFNKKFGTNLTGAQYVNRKHYLTFYDKKTK